MRAAYEKDRDPPVELVLKSQAWPHLPKAERGLLAPPVPKQPGLFAAE